MTLELFSKKMEPDRRRPAPLADRMRPRTLGEIVGQEEIVGPGSPLHRQIETEQIPSLIFWGPPGSGKTTVARVIAHESQAAFFGLSAVLAGVKDLKEILDEAGRLQRLEGRRTILFVDEIHRWNKAQQDALLPHIEDGTIILIGATTENPSFEVIGPLLSRTKVIVLPPLAERDLEQVVQRALEDRERGLGNLALTCEPEALKAIAATSDGDARRALNTLEIAASLLAGDRCADDSPVPPAVAARTGEARSSRQTTKSVSAGDRSTGRVMTVKLVEQALQKKSILYDKAGEEHYNQISAFIKSMRGSDPDAAVYWLARMLEAGEDPLFLARRMVIFASEDVGNADPQALPLAEAAAQAFERVGLPEGWIPLAQAATYLASAPKSKASYYAYLEAKKDVEKEGALPVPLSLRNPVTPLMEEIGYGKGPKEFFLPEKLKGRRYYEPPKR